MPDFRDDAGCFFNLKGTRLQLTATSHILTLQQQSRAINFRTVFKVVWYVVYKKRDSILVVSRGIERH